MEEMPFGPEVLYAAYNDTCPDLAGGLDESNRSNVTEINRIKNFGKWSEKTPLPCRAAHAMLPE
jgi:hypothetical protein